MAKKSFILFKDTLSVLDDLTDEQAGLLFKAIRNYQNEQILELDALTKIAFSPFKSQFERHEISYATRVEANKTNGLKGGRPKKPKITEDIPNKPNGLKETQAKPNNHDSDSDSDSDSGKDKIKKTTALPLDYSQLGFTDNQIDDLKRIRKANKGTKLTQRIVNALAVEFHNAASKGYSFDELLTEWEVRGWKSFKADWIDTKQSNDAPQGLSKLGQKSWNNIKDVKLTV